ncbi:MAG: chorismate-binding protein [Deltaproteobacteria bacterium]|nr:chorismate-binding protein [Deltaproteobacteria bacterium]
MAPVFPSESEFVARVKAVGRDRARGVVWREIPADLDTPVGAFLKLDTGGPAFLLESVTGGDRWGRYSVIGIDPEAMVTVGAGEGDAWALLRERLLPFAPNLHSAVPISGAVGFVGYDAVRAWERLPERTPLKRGRRAPDAMFIVPRTIVTFDNLRHRMMVSSSVTVAGSSPEAAYADAVRRVDAVVAALRAPIPNDRNGPTKPATPVFSEREPRAAFEAKVERIKEYIAAGDAIQVVISRRFEVKAPAVDLFQVYRELRTSNPSPYLFFLRGGDVTLVGASPEILVKVTPGADSRAIVEVRPIAGTRPRGATEDDDRRLADELCADAKERAEHLMLVDLGRNDVGRVAKVGSVSVPEFMTVERYSHVMHLVSHVKGELDPQFDAYDAARAAFPAGTLSGAPKVRAMEIIDELEGARRGPYGGAVGMLGWDGSANLAITIRTLVASRDEWVVQAGAGIVADSDAAREAEECENKARAVMAAIERAAGPGE